MRDYFEGDLNFSVEQAPDPKEIVWDYVDEGTHI